MGTLEKARLNFDGTRREFNKLELKRVRQQQAKDAVEPELASQLSAKQVSLDGELGWGAVSEVACSVVLTLCTRLASLRTPSSCCQLIFCWVV